LVEVRGLMLIFIASFLACMISLTYLAVLGALGFIIDQKDLDNIIFLILVVGVVSILGMVALFLMRVVI